MSAFKLFFAFLIILITAPFTASAQISFNNGLPIDASSDDALNQPGVTTLSGQVDIRQGDTRILADTVKLFSNSSQAMSLTADIHRIEANGNFYLITSEQEVRGDKGIYLNADNTFTVSGNVILLQGENIITGNRLIYNLTTEEARMVGNCKGRRCGKTGRVNILIKSTNNQGA